MKSNAEMLATLKGTKEEKLSLFNEMFDYVTAGNTLDDGELIMFETLKNMLFKPQSQVVNIGASLNGSGGLAS